MNYIKHCDYVPFWKREDPATIINNQTRAMRWIQEARRDVPEYLRHDPDLLNNHGLSGAMYWIKHVKTPVPKYLEMTLDSLL